jgi:hypothetical protein
MAVNETFELAVQGTVVGQRHIHTLHFRSLSLEADEANLAADWQTNLRTSFRACFFAADKPVELLKVRKVCGTLPLPSVYELVEAGATQAGTRTAGSVQSPALIAALVKEKGVFAGRKRSGRFFMSGSNIGDINLHDFQPAYIAIIQSYATALAARYISSGSASPWRLVTHSRALAAEQPPLDCEDSSTLVQALIVSTRVTTMRSRKLGHGT